MKRSLFFLFAICFSLIGCKGKKDSANLPSYSGSPGDIIVVAPSSIWENGVGDSLKMQLNPLQKGLPREESLFHLVNIPPSKLTRVFKTYRNLLFLSIDADKADVKIKRNVWAKGQLMAEVKSPNASVLLSLLNEHAPALQEAFYEEDLKRLQQDYITNGNTSLSKKLRKKEGVSIALMKSMKLAKEIDGFYWLRSERQRPTGGYQHQVSQGILLYTVPYNDSSQFKASYLLSVSDSIKKKHIPGPEDGNYMTTSYRFQDPSVYPINHNGKYALFIRGLWRMENNFMGGPFISLTTLHPSGEHLIVVEGYVYAPQFNKMDYLREVEAMVKSLAFSTEATTSAAPS